MRRPPSSTTRRSFGILIDKFALHPQASQQDPLPATRRRAKALSLDTSAGKIRHQDFDISRLTEAGPANLPRRSCSNSQPAS